MRTPIQKRNDCYKQCYYQTHSKKCDLFSTRTAFLGGTNIMLQCLAKYSQSEKNQKAGDQLPGT